MENDVSDFVSAAQPGQVAIPRLDEGSLASENEGAFVLGMKEPRWLSGI
jgi:hypothetical protein